MTLEDIFNNPDLIIGWSPHDVLALVPADAVWRVGWLLRGDHRGQGWALREYTKTGQLTGRMIRWHPGGGHHGPDPYWRVSSGKGGRSVEIPAGALE